MTRGKKTVERKRYFCAECGNEMGSKWLMGFELTCSEECRAKNDAKWRAKSDKEPSREPEGRLSGVTAYSNNPDSPFMQWMAKEGATVEPKSESLQVNQIEWRWLEAEIGCETECGKCRKVHEQKMEPAAFLIDGENPLCLACVEQIPGAYKTQGWTIEAKQVEAKKLIGDLDQALGCLTVARTLQKPGPLNFCAMCGEVTEDKLPGTWQVCGKCWDDATWPVFGDI